VDSEIPKIKYQNIKKLVSTKSYFVGVLNIWISRPRYEIHENWFPISM